MKIRRIISRLLLIAAICSSPNMMAQKDTVAAQTDLLIVTSYMHNDWWSRPIILRVMQKVGLEKNLKMRVEYMNFLSITNHDMFKQYKDNFFTSYGADKPKAVLMLGSAPLLLRDEMCRRWGDVPIILCAESKYVASDSVYIYNKIASQEDRIYLNTLHRDYNLTYMRARPFIIPSVDLVMSMLPDMKNLILVGDQTSRVLDYDQAIRDYITESHPDIDYRFLSAGRLTEEQLLDTLCQVSPTETGVLFSSWFYRRTFAGRVVLMENASTLIANSVIPTPFFALSVATSGIRGDKNLIGGCVYDTDLYCDKVIAAIGDVLDGKRASDIEPYEPEPIVMFNHDNMKNFGLSTDSCPPGAILLNVPPTFWQKHRFSLMAGGLLLLLVISVSRRKQNKIKSDLQEVEQKQGITHTRLITALDVADMYPWAFNLVTDELRFIISGDKDTLDTPAAIVISMSNHYNSIHPDDRQHLQTLVDNLRTSSSTEFKAEYRIQRAASPQGHYDWLSSFGFVEEYDDEGTPLKLFGFTSFVTKRKAAESELIMAKERAEESNRLKSAFLANISHEIRTPLNAIVGFSSILPSVEVEEERQEYIELIEKNNDLLLQLINDVLDLSKIEAGAINLDYTVFSLNRIMHTVRNSIAMRLNPRVQLLFEPQMTDDYTVCSDQHRLQQLVINLLTNACKFTSHGSIRYGYKLRPGSIYYYVADTGTGIPKDDIDSIFERFVKLDRFKQGTGLGLAICRLIVQNMGGEIGVRSVLGEGSTFWFTLPIHPAQ